MSRAIAEARAGIAAGQTPFGAVIVLRDELVASAHNEVWLRHDPTAHAEIVAIQRAAMRLGGISLEGCRIYTTCEPCPMCAAALHWARLDEIHYGARIADAQRAGFGELELPAAELLARGKSRVRCYPGVLEAACAELFDEWLARPDRRIY